jgi:hypothetical protein
MKLKDYNLLHWKGNQINKKITIRGTTILLLELDMTLMPPEEGRKNLIAVDTNETIIWIADLPKVPYASYHDMKIMDENFYAWAGSQLCEIDIKTGKIIKEKFVK